MITTIYDLLAVCIMGSATGYALCRFILEPLLALHRSGELRRRVLGAVMVLRDRATLVRSSDMAIIMWHCGEHDHNHVLLHLPRDPDEATPIPLVDSQKAVLSALHRIDHDPEFREWLLEYLQAVTGGQAPHEWIVGGGQASDNDNDTDTDADRAAHSRPRGTRLH